MQSSWKDSIYLQREQLALILREPLARLAGKCTPAWNDRERLNDVLLDGFAGLNSMDAYPVVPEVLRREMFL